MDVDRMSIFISDEAKQKFQSFWFGLATPILIGGGCSLFSLGVLSTHDGPVSEFSYVEYFFAVFWILGHLVLWPLSAWWLFRRAKKLENLHLKRGSLISMSVAFFWVTSTILLGLTLHF
ncbi:MAG: hypothetical protein CMB49_00585 [Euryarchaeota archaeon]|nr:hypothetical protein [Euryarchaeota archaeon]